MCACCCLLLIYIINDDSICIEYIENVSIKRAVSCQLLFIVKHGEYLLYFLAVDWGQMRVSVESVESNVERKRFEGEKSKAKQQRQPTRGYISNSQIQNKK